jgi:hypothetical protein
MGFTCLHNDHCASFSRVLNQPNSFELSSPAHDAASIFAHERGRINHFSHVHRVCSSETLGCSEGGSADHEIVPVEDLIPDRNKGGSEEEVQEYELPSVKSPGKDTSDK